MQPRSQERTLNSCRGTALCGQALLYCFSRILPQGTSFRTLHRYKKDFQKEVLNNGILKGCSPFSGFQRQSLWWGVGQRPANCLKRSAKGELKNSPVDCFLRGNALQGRAFPYQDHTFENKKDFQKEVLFIALRVRHRFQNHTRNLCRTSRDNPLS